MSAGTSLNCPGFLENTSEEPRQSDWVILSFARHRSAAGGPADKMYVAAPCTIAAAAPRGAFALQLLREVGAHVAEKKAGALPPGRSVEALIGVDGCDAWVVQKPSETGLQPNEAEGRIFDNKRYPCVQESPANKSACPGGAIADADALQSVSCQTWNAERELRRPERTLRRDLLDARVGGARRSQHRAQHASPSRVARDTALHAPAAQIPTWAEYAVEEVAQTPEVGELVPDRPRATEAVQKPMLLQREGGGPTSREWTIIPSRALSQPSHHVRRPGVRRHQLAVKLAAFSYRWVFLMLAQRPRRVTSS